MWRCGHTLGMVEASKSSIRPITPSLDTNDISRSSCRGRGRKRKRVDIKSVTEKEISSLVAKKKKKE